MSSIQRREDNATELRLDYQDISTGQLVIVIQGLPTAVVDASAGVPRIVPAAQSSRGGRHASPSSPLIDEARSIGNAAAYAPVLVTSLVLAAWRGQEVRALELIAATIEDAPAEDERQAIVNGDYAKAVLYNGLGRYRDAVIAAERACVHEDLASFECALLELVEAGVRSNAPTVASQALARLDELSRRDGSDWMLGVRARSAALLTEGGEAEHLYQDAIERLGRGSSVHLARAQLVYGEWLRRENRRVDARIQLRAAHNTFSDITAEAFAERALRELLATGETARKRNDESRAYLTPQEAQIARLARDGFSNPEIGAQLFISPRTVQYHLRKVFQKFNITSRNQLSRVSSERLAA